MKTFDEVKKGECIYEINGAGLFFYKVKQKNLSHDYYSCTNSLYLKLDNGRELFIPSVYKHQPNYMTYYASLEEALKDFRKKIIFKTFNNKQ